MKAGILLFDENVLVAFKPNNVDFDNFTTQLTAKVNQKRVCSITPLYELERESSGVVLYTQNEETRAQLTEQMNNGEFEMTYYAVVVGQPKADKGIYSACVKRDSQTGLLNHIPLLNEGAINFSFSYQVLEKVDKISLIKISATILDQELIRFGLSDLGVPVFGDKDYKGDALAKDTFVALSLVDVRFNKPSDETTMTFRAVPEDKPWSYFNLDKWFKI